MGQEIGPLGFADILDGAFQLYREAARTIVALALLVLVPIQLVVAFLGRDSLLSGGLAGILQDPSAADALSGGAADIGPVAIGFALAQGLVLPLLAGAYIAVAHAVTMGEVPTLTTAWTAIRRHGPALLVGWWVHALAYGVLVFPILIFLLGGSQSVAGAVIFFPIGMIGTVALIPLLLLIAPAIIVEGMGPIAAVRRSIELGRQRYFPLLGLVLGSAFVIGLIGALLGGIPEGAALFSGLGYAWVLLAAATTLSALISGPLSAHIALLAFLDTRVRVEGHDLIIRARRLRGLPADALG